MKSLKESLFDDNLASKEVLVQRVIKYFERGINENDIDDIIDFIITPKLMNFHIQNPDFLEWANKFRGSIKNLNDSFGFVASSYEFQHNGGQASLNRIKPGTIHNTVSDKDKEDTANIGFPTYFWNYKSRDIKTTEWIIFYSPRNPESLYILANSKDYKKYDQKIIHAMINALSKYYKH